MFNCLITRYDLCKAVCTRLAWIYLVQTKPIYRWIATLSFAFVITLTSQAPVAYAKTYPKEQVRAAFLFNFLKFVEWPAPAFDNDDSPFHICMFGDIGSKKIFDKLSQQKAQSRSIEIDYTGVGNNSNLDDYAFDACHIVYLGFIQTDRAIKVIQAVEDKPTLTVSIIDDFIAKGGMIALVSEDKKNKLQINLKAAQSVDLKISANMLDVAEIVQP